MIDLITIFKIHQLQDAGLSIQAISETLQLRSEIIADCLGKSTPKKTVKKKANNGRSFNETILRILELDLNVSAVVIQEKFEGHIKKQKTLHQGLLNAFIFFGDTPEEIVDAFSSEGQVPVDYLHAFTAV